MQYQYSVPFSSSCLNLLTDRYCPRVASCSSLQMLRYLLIYSLRATNQLAVPTGLSWLCKSKARELLSRHWEILNNTSWVWVWVCKPFFSVFQKKKYADHRLFFAEDFTLANAPCSNSDTPLPHSSKSRKKKKGWFEECGDCQRCNKLIA